MLNTPMARTTREVITNFECPLEEYNGYHFTAPAIFTHGFNYPPIRPGVLISNGVEPIQCLDQSGSQLIHVKPRFSRYRYRIHVRQICVGVPWKLICHMLDIVPQCFIQSLNSLLHDYVVCAAIVNFCDQGENRDPMLCREFDALGGLGFDPLVNIHNQKDQIGEKRGVVPHSCKNTMSRGIEECNSKIVQVDRKTVSILGDSTSLKWCYSPAPQAVH
mmetsp:Transcript_1089/g.2061  ORF Transcript_1089/g.2061 Transcript_1089/m.2061 type:complete len:218 (-) Transcript_1089:465-1118(-)